MKLSEDQLKAVSAWFAGGASLDGIQKRLVAEYGVHVTYFDLRMIVAELPQPEEDAQQRVPPEEDGPGEDAQERVPPEEGDAGGARCRATEEQEADAQERVPPGVMVECDAIMIPGTMASGDVVFSDGQKGKWYLDQMGRLGLGGDLPQGYRPSPEDAALFQARLMEVLRSKGLC